jgi:hypothetical protein
MGTSPSKADYIGRFPLLRPRQPFGPWILDGSKRAGGLVVIIRATIARCIAPQLAGLRPVQSSATLLLQAAYAASTIGCTGGIEGGTASTSVAAVEHPVGWGTS